MSQDERRGIVIKREGRITGINEQDGSYLAERNVANRHEVHNASFKPGARRTLGFNELSQS
jgi:hypothetical protein